MSARFEVVRTDGRGHDQRQYWHGRLVVNGRITWVTEMHSRMVGVERAILSLLNAVGLPVRSMGWNVEGREKVLYNEDGLLLAGGPLVHYVDERTGASS